MATTLKRLAAHELHIEAKAHLGAFGEWEVPLYFSSILEEHEAVRTRAGLFDISHMGEFFISGRNAACFLDTLLPRRIARLADGRALYAPMLNAEGGIVDDLIVYQKSPERFLLIVNASNIDKDFKWIESFPPSGVELEDASERKCLFALQGPRSAAIARSLFGCDFVSLGYYRFLSLKTKWGDVVVSRTGYTGEDGFELMAEMSEAVPLWKSIREAGRPAGLLPIGFGARDTLRLEAGMLLYGQDMDDSTTAIEAGLDWALDLEKPEFVGKARNAEEKRIGPSRRLVGFEMKGRGIPRHGYDVRKNGRGVGRVTSGSFGPTLKKNIGLAYVPYSETQSGGTIEIGVRGEGVPAKIVDLPFYRRKQ